MKPLWRDIYPWIGGAVFNLDSVDSLLWHTVAAIADTYASDCAIWVGLESHAAATPFLYTTAGLSTELAAGETLAAAHPDSLTGSSISQFHLKDLPDWLREQQENPQIATLSQGDLIIPVVSRTRRKSSPLDAGQDVRSLPLVIQLRRREQTLTTASLGHTPLTNAPSSEPWHGWRAEEVESLEVVASQLGLAYSALYWRHWLEQSRRQAALVGRIAHLLNSSLNSDEIVERIVAELGQGFQCDRCILVNLRVNPAIVMATWDHPHRRLELFQHHRMEATLWQAVIDLFLQDGASYLTIARSELEPDSEALLDWLNQMEAASALLIPLFVQSDFLGTVCLLSYQQERIYSVDELQTVRQVADHAAIALTNAQHYQSLWHRQEALRLQNTSLQQEVIRDELTQLMNRRSLERELAQLSSKALWTCETPFSVVMCDIDYFKLVNDTYGHRIGDEILQNLALRLRQQLRRDTPAYRYGGEEFVIILPETILNRAVTVAERLRYAIRSTPIKTSAGLVEVTASFGVAQQDPSRDNHAWDVLQRSDQALYEAKRQGRDRVKAS